MLLLPFLQVKINYLNKTLFTLGRRGCGICEDGPKLRNTTRWEQALHFREATRHRHAKTDARMKRKETKSEVSFYLASSRLRNSLSCSLTAPFLRSFKWRACSQRIAFLSIGPHSQFHNHDAQQAQRLVSFIFSWQKRKINIIYRT